LVVTVYLDMLVMTLLWSVGRSIKDKAD
jgi:hypothetical protein